MHTSAERDYLKKALEIAVRLAVVGLMVLAAFRVFSPFLVTAVWAIIIAITADPLYRTLTRLVGGRAKLACALFITLSLGAVLVPAGLLGDSLLEATVGIVKKAEAGTLVIPAPTEQVKTWPVIGERVHALWYGASVDLEGTIAKLQPQVHDLGQSIVSGVSEIGKAFAQTLLALVIAGLLMLNAEGGSRSARAIAGAVAGDAGPRIIDTGIGTIRSVVKGVVLVALIQGLLAAVGLVVVGVPGAGLWSLLVMIVAIVQLPPLLVLAPVAFWVFANHDSTALAVFFAVWSLLVSISDGVLKPLLLGRGVPVPMLVILIGAIGGMMRSGLIGLFIGPVVLALFHQIFMAWVHGAGSRAGDQKPT